MIFATSIGNLDVIQGDYVKVSDEILPTPESMAGYLLVIQVSGSNTKQMQVQYSDNGVDKSTWLDATWVCGNMRPILPS